MEDPWMKDGYPATFFAIFVLSTIFGMAIGGMITIGCSAISDAPFGCVEFIVARYQTLLAAIVALFAAFIAVTPVFRQLRQMTIQTGISQIERLEKRLETFKTDAQEIRRSVDWVRLAAPGGPSFPGVHILTDISSGVLEINAIIVRFGAHSAHSRYLITQLRELLSQAMTFEDKMRAVDRGRFNRVTADEERQLFLDASAAYSELENASRMIIFAADDEVHNVEEIIRDIENFTLN